MSVVVHCGDKFVPSEGRAKGQSTRAGEEIDHGSRCDSAGHLSSEKRRHCVANLRLSRTRGPSEDHGVRKRLEARGLAIAQHTVGDRVNRAAVTWAVVVHVNGVGGSVRMEAAVVGAPRSPTVACSVPDLLESTRGDVCWDIAPIAAWRDGPDDAHVEVRQSSRVVIRHQGGSHTAPPCSSASTVVHCSSVTVAHYPVICRVPAWLSRSSVHRRESSPAGSATGAVGSSGTRLAAAGIRRLPIAKVRVDMCRS